MRKFLVSLLSFLVLISLISLAAAAEAPKEKNKQTTLGKYVTAAEAYEMYKANPKKVKVIDCRTPEEYVFVGHAPMAHNIPSKLWTGKWDDKKKEFVLRKNHFFEVKAAQIFRPDDTILIMCRSGARSADSVNRLAKWGFTNVYNIVDGFEGDKVKDKESYFDGKRLKNGWKNSGAPWTYKLDPRLVYQY